VLEGARPEGDVPIAALVDDSLGLQAFMHVDALHRFLGEGDVVTGAAVTLDGASRDRFYREVKRMPLVAGIALREVTLQNFRDTMAETMNLSIFLNVFFAGIIAFGVVYNSARIALSERDRELASLRVLGFTRGEVAYILLGELAVLTLLAIPFGFLLGALMSVGVVESLQTDLYQFPVVLGRSTFGLAATVVLTAATLSALIIRRRLQRLDLIGVLKTRE
jgi:putative ABC transport system permease protein